MLTTVISVKVRGKDCRPGFSAILLQIMKGVAPGGGSEWFMKLKLGFSDGLDPVRDI